MTPDERRPATDDDLDRLVDAAVDIADGFYGDGPIDWEGLFDRLEQWTNLDLPPSWDHPIYGRIKRRVRKARADS